MNFGWQNLEFEHAIIILPIKDSKEHIISDEVTNLDIAIKICRCKPRIETCGKLIIIHNSFDGREFFEDEIVEGANVKWH